MTSLKNVIIYKSNNSFQITNNLNKLEEIFNLSKHLIK
jgi:hypothetical protein